MKKLLYLVTLLSILELLFQQCANPRSPTGGPKDTIPPTLLESYPQIGSTNFKDQELEFQFSELISADKLKQELIIAPSSDIKYKSIVKKNRLIMRFEEPFADSTTYYFSFADGVGDITERNPVINFTLAFSTGSYIDSLEVTGKVIDLYNQEPVKGYTVGLYPFTDSLDFFKQTPFYFTTTDDDGNFLFNYLKNGSYRLITFNDDNRNQILDPETEAHGFIAGVIQLDSSIIIEKPIPIILQNVKPIKFINSRPTGPYYELRYSKTISKYSISDSIIHSTIVGENKDVIRLYKPETLNYNDSLQLIIQATDTLNNHSIDTVSSIFLESNRKLSNLSYNVTSLQDVLTDNHVFQASFSKPINFVDSSKFGFMLDTIFTSISSPSFRWNKNRTQVSIESNIIKDSILSRLFSAIPTDTLKTNEKDSTEIAMKFENLRSQVNLLFDQKMWSFYQ